MIKTTLDIVKILPFGKKFKVDLMARFSNLTPDQKFTVERVVWDLYIAVYKIRLQENLQKALANQQTLNLPDDPEMMKKVRAETEKQMEKEFEIKGNEIDISAVRSKLKSLINEKPITN